MAPTNPTRPRDGRRDKRHGLAPDVGSVLFFLGAGRACRGTLVEAGIASLTFRTDENPETPIGTRICGATVRLFASAVTGDLVVKRYDALGDAGYALGCLFYPDVGRPEALWASMLSASELRSAGPPTEESLTTALAIRCGSCHAAIWVPRSDWTETTELEARCSFCSSRHVLNPERDLQEPAREGAREIAIDNQIDLAGAYSVLLGILSLEQVLDMFALDHPVAGPAAGGAPEVPAEATPATEPESHEQGPELSSEELYDPEFQGSIDAGRLTAGQAIQRGNRQTFATRLSQRHKLPMEVAYAVADGALSLLDAVRERALQQRDSEPIPAVRQGSLVLKLVATVVLSLVALGGLEVWQRLPDADETEELQTAVLRERNLLASTSIGRSDSGIVGEIRGPDPRGILMAYCRSLEEYDRCVPQLIAPLRPPDPAGRLGIFQNRNGKRMAIRIERRGGARTWIAGDGKVIPVLEAPDIPPNTPTVRVSSIVDGRR